MADTADLQSTIQVSSDLFHTAANSGSDTPLSDIAKGVLADAALGTAVAWGTGVAVTALAVAIGSDVATAATVAVAAGTAIATGAGAGTALGSALGPIGAAVGVVIGVFAGLFSTVDTSHYGDPAYGTLLGTWASAYLQSHPINPILAVQLAHDPTFQVALRGALNDFIFEPFDNSFTQVFKFDSSGDAMLRTDTPTGAAIHDFLADLVSKEVPKATVYKIIDLYCDFISRVRAAEVEFVKLHPGSVANLKDEPRVGTDPPWITADQHATLAFLGVDENNYKKFWDVNVKAAKARGDNSDYPVLPWEGMAPALLGFDVNTQAKEPGSWPSMTSSPYFKDIQQALRFAYDNIAFDHAAATSPALNLIPNRGLMNDTIEYAKEKAQEAMEVVYKDGEVTKVGKIAGGVAAVIVVLKLLGKRR